MLPEIGVAFGACHPMSNFRKVGVSRSIRHHRLVVGKHVHYLHPNADRAHQPVPRIPDNQVRGQGRPVAMSPSI